MELALTQLLVFVLFILGMIGLTATVSVTINGFSNVAVDTTVTDEAGLIANPTVLAGQAGTLTTRTSGTAGTLTLNTGHGITTGQRIDLYWAGGSAYGLTVGTVATNSVPFTGASGDALPVATTAIVVGICNSVVFAFTGNNLSLLTVKAGYESYVVVWDGSINDLAIHLTAGASYEWHGVGTNPLASKTPTLCYVSHAYTGGPDSRTACNALFH